MQINGFCPLKIEINLWSKYITSSWYAQMDLLTLLDDLIINFINTGYSSLLMAWWTSLMMRFSFLIVVLTELFKIELLSSAPKLLYIQVFHSYFAQD